ncbi:hypothetical protein U0070_005590 [Myodes glareolus]|uniref:Ig-like domain-containing protein n=1 Tax=Myodes glareolus TaxID=447135 RepID=A0AAW0IM45_MYOGA
MAAAEDRKPSAVPSVLSPPVPRAPPAAAGKVSHGQEVSTLPSAAATANAPRSQETYLTTVVVLTFLLASVVLVMVYGCWKKQHMGRDSEPKKMGAGGGIQQECQTEHPYLLPCLLPSSLRRGPMAWEATYLLSPILLVLLASGSWAQDAELLPAVEGQTIFVKCQYNSSQHSKEKIWCQKTSTESCKSLVSSLSTDKQWPKFFIREYPKSHFFTVTMTTLTVRDSGLYVCGISGNSREIIILKSIYLAVSKGEHPPSM